MSSCSKLPRSELYGSGYCRVRLRPRLLASAESLKLPYELVDMAHLEFLRITDVTESTSESKMCFNETEACAGDIDPLASAMLKLRSSRVR